MAQISPRPAAGILTGPYWRLGATGQLHLLRCDCGHFNHPPKPRCRECGGSALAWRAVSGRGVVHGYGIDERWGAGPQVFALVELVEQEGLRIFAPVDAPDPAAVGIGTAVRVAFQRVDDDARGDAFYLPVFEVAS